VLASETAITGLSFTANGSTMYVNGSTSDVVHQLTLTTPWSVNTATYPIATQQKTITLGTELIATAMRFSSNGAFLYVVGSTIDTVQKFTLSTPWDISTASLTQSFALKALKGG
jgi:sugar lactone lactonase YvrE